jgi:diacylglycerol kinase-like protein
MTAPRPALLVVNPHSRRGGSDMAHLAARILEDNGVPVVQRPYKDAAGLPELIRGMAGRIDRVVIGGGDGTLNAAAPALLATGLPFGVIPLGTANDLARTLGIPLDPEEAALVAITGRRRRKPTSEQPGYGRRGGGQGYDRNLGDGVIREFPRTGSPVLGNNDVGTTTPTLYWGKGLGDLPIGWLRPLAITGTIGYQYADKRVGTVVAQVKRPVRGHDNSRNRKSPRRSAGARRYNGDPTNSARQPSVRLTVAQSWFDVPRRP